MISQAAALPTQVLMPSIVCRNRSTRHCASLYADMQEQGTIR